MSSQRRTEQGRNEEAWRALRQVRWPLAGAVALAFALTQALDALLLYGLDWSTQLTINVVVWGGIGALAAWGLLTWAVAQERRYRNVQIEALEEQRRLNTALQRSNSNLALLNEVNRRIASSATIDEVLDYAIGLPERLVHARAAALVASGNWTTDADPVGVWLGSPAPLLLRCWAAAGVELDQLRVAYGLDRRGEPPQSLELLAPLLPEVAGVLERAGVGTCLLVPVSDGDLPLGWLECYLPIDGALADDLGELMETIAGEIGEAVGAAQRRTHELEDRYALDRAVDEERARIARDMHDGIAQNLAFLRMRADLWSDWLASEPERLPAEFATFKATMREQIGELRRAIFALRPLDLNELGFDGALRRFVNDFAAQQGWQATLALSEPLPELPPALELACFRLVQEALTNAAKHADASSVRVALRTEHGGLSIAVADNGRGFDPGSVEGSDRLGLRQMRERIAALSGRLTVLSRAGAGTEVRAWVPL